MFLANLNSSQRFQDSNVTIQVRLFLSCNSSRPLGSSYNVIGQVNGTEWPEQVVLLGGHIDSWDVGSGAMDDGGGIVACYFALHTLQKLGLFPKRTIRVIGWVDEENTGAGEKAYFASLSALELSQHVLAIESDSGVFNPTSFTKTDDATPGQSQLLHEIVTYLMKGVGRTQMQIVTSDGGADTDLLREAGVPVSELLSDGSKYFWYHHSDADTIDKLNSDEVADCVSALAILIHIVADYPIPFNSL